MGIKFAKYNDDKKIYNGTTTIVYGSTVFKRDTEVINTLERAVAILGEICFYGNNGEYTGKGVAKLHPDDMYSQETGMAIASMKAELNGNKAMVHDLKIALDLISNCETVLTESIAELDARANRIRDILKLKY